MAASIFSAGAVKILKDILKFKDGTTLTSTVAGYLSTISSAVQTQFDNITGKTDKILETSHLHESGDFPNTTNLYAWHINGSSDYDDGDWIGSKALAENGALTSILTDASVNDVLGNDTFCYFDGTNDYLSSADAVFNMVGSFSLSMWAYMSDWTPAGVSTLSSRSDAANGWTLLVNTDGAIGFYNYTGGAYEGYTHQGGLTAGWHHIALVRDDGTSTAVYIDGKCMDYTNLHANITAAGNLEIGAINGGTNKFTGGIQEVAIDTDTAWTANQVRKIYAAGCRKLCAEDADGKVTILDGRVYDAEIIIYPVADYTITDTMANATGYSLPLSEDGDWEIDSQLSVYVADSDAAAAQVYVQLYDGTNVLTALRAQYAADNNTFEMYVPMKIESTRHLTKDTAITVRAQMANGDSCKLKYNDDIEEPFLRARKKN